MQQQGINKIVSRSGTVSLFFAPAKPARPRPWRPLSSALVSCRSLNTDAHPGAQAGMGICINPGVRVFFYTRFLYARIAKTYATTVIPTHHATAIQMPFPTGTAGGMVAVGTNAELMNGRKSSG